MECQDIVRNPIAILARLLRIGKSLDKNPLAPEVDPSTHLHGVAGIKIIADLDGRHLAGIERLLGTVDLAESELALIDPLWGGTRPPLLETRHGNTSGDSRWHSHLGGRGRNRGGSAPAVIDLESQLPSAELAPVSGHRHSGNREVTGAKRHHDVAVDDGGGDLEIHHLDLG